MAVPKEARLVAGKKVVQCSLGTSDRREATIRAGKMRSELFEQWGLLASEPEPPSRFDARAVAVGVGFDDMLAALDQSRSKWPNDDAEYSSRLAKREADLRRLTRRLHQGDLADWEAVADRVIGARELPIEHGTEQYQVFVQSIAEATIDAIGVFTRRAAGELDAAPRTAVVLEAKAREAEKARTGETLLELFELWGAEMIAKGQLDGKRGKRRDTVNQDRKVIQQFAEFVGRDRAVDSITPAEVFEYRETLRMLPPKWMSKRELRGLDMRAAAAKARAEGMDQTAFTTINKHLSTISPLYTWLRKRPRWAGLTNPVDGLFHDDVKGANPRPPFTCDTLNRILGSPLFTGFEAEGREHLPGKTQADDWRLWVPLVAMFTGARIGEIAQLRVSDVQRHRGVGFIQIRHEAKEGLSTKSGKSRFAAIHSMLEAIGFLSFHQRQLERAEGNGDRPLFPELAPNSRGQISGTPSRWWRDYLEAIGVKDGGDGMGAHSFRHTLADRLRVEAKLLDNEIAVCLGHNLKSVTSEYGDIPQGTVDMFKNWIEGVQFEGVDFTHLIAAENARTVAA